MGSKEVESGVEWYDKDETREVEWYGWILSSSLSECFTIQWEDKIIPWSEDWTDRI